jgi:RNA polymerase sigma-70 factor (ECF subfamily)
VRGVPWSLSSDEDLLRGVAAGQEEAFAEIYRRYQGLVHRFAYRMTGSADAAEDVAHTCFASLIESPLRFQQGRVRLGTYLCAAARNQCLKRLRARRREVTDGDPDSRQSPDSAGPLRQLLDDERTRVVREAIAKLAPLHREVLVLVEYEGLDLATVAEIVGAQTGAVKVRIHRARQKLRRILEGYMSAGQSLVGGVRT